MQSKPIAVSQFDGTVNLLKLNLISGEREIIAADTVNEDHVSFGLFELESEQPKLEYLALLATPDGPLLVFDDDVYYPEPGKTTIDITDDGNHSHFKLMDDGELVFGLFYESKFGIGLHPYNRTREDIDFYYWLSKKISDPKFYTTYTKDIEYLS